MPRLGEHRPLQGALEAHWAGGAPTEELEETAAAVRRANWQLLADSGLDFVPSWRSTAPCSPPGAARCLPPTREAPGRHRRPPPISVEWFRHAQARTKRPVKGMLTGPVTMLRWSFVRDDQPQADTATQLGIAIADELHDLQGAGAAIIQVDEPALREGLPPCSVAHAPTWHGDEGGAPGHRSRSTGHPGPHPNVLRPRRRDRRRGATTRSALLWRTWSPPPGRFGPSWLEETASQATTTSET